MASRGRPTIRKRKLEDLSPVERATVEKINLQAEVIRLDLVRQSGELDRLRAIERDLVRAVIAFSKAALNIGPKVAAEVAGESDPGECAQIITRAAREALEELKALALQGGSGAGNA